MNTSTVSSAPDDSVIPVTTMLAVAAGDDFSCVLVQSAVYCWGDDGEGQVSGVPGELRTPTLTFDHGCTRLLAGGSSVACASGTGIEVKGRLAGTLPAGQRDLALGERVGCMVGADGQLACWGDQRSPLFGALAGDAAFLKGLRKACDAHKVLLILDEVMTSRVDYGGVQRRVGVKPDLMTLGKYVGGGLSFGAFGGKAEIMARFDPSRPDAFPHGGTFNNNVLAMTAGYAALTQVLSEERLKKMNDLGDTIRERRHDPLPRCLGVSGSFRAAAPAHLHPSGSETAAEGRSARPTWAPAARAATPTPAPHGAPTPGKPGS